MTLLGCQTHIAAAQCQAVVLALYRACHNLQLEALQLHHLADNGNLLEVLLSEVCTVGLHEAEQLAHNLRHPVEMAGTVRTLHHLSHRAKVELAVVGLWINLLYRRHKHHVASGSLQKRAVALLCAWICSQILLVVELCRVDENAHHNNIVLLAGTVDKRLVSSMQRTHGRNQTDRLIFLLIS